MHQWYVTDSFKKAQTANRVQGFREIGEVISDETDDLASGKARMKKVRNYFDKVNHAPYSTIVTIGVIAFCLLTLMFLIGSLLKVNSENRRLQYSQSVDF